LRLRGFWLLLVLSSFNHLQAQNKGRSQKDEKGEAPAAKKLKVGEMAPDFTLLAFDGKGPVSLTRLDVMRAILFDRPRQEPHARRLRDDHAQSGSTRDVYAKENRVSK
jgi:hypothetical protein